MGSNDSNDSNKNEGKFWILRWLDKAREINEKTWEDLYNELTKECTYILKSHPLHNYHHLHIQYYLNIIIINILT